MLPNRAKTWISAVLLSAGLMTLDACLVLVPASKRTSAPPELENKIDLSFISPGTTTRQEVHAKLRWSSFVNDEPGIFWGRWSTSSSGVLWGIGGGQAPVPPKGGAFRVWDTRNVIIAFDDAGVVRSSRVVADPAVIAEIRRLLTPKTDGFEPPVTLKLDHLRYGRDDNPVKLELTRDRFSYFESGFKKGTTKSFAIPPQKIIGITISNLRRPKGDLPWEMWFTLQFSEKTSAGKNVSFAGDPATLMRLIRYQVDVCQRKP